MNNSNRRTNTRKEFPLEVYVGKSTLGGIRIVEVEKNNYRISAEGGKRYVLIKGQLGNWYLKDVIDGLQRGVTDEKIILDLIEKIPKT